MGLLISAEELASLSDWVIFDCRFSLMDPDMGRNQYTQAHIPDARYADLNLDLSAEPGKGGRHPLPDRESLAEQLRIWGVHNDSIIACYDQNSGAFAARLWWLLRWLGHEAVFVLDGGLDAWLNTGFSTDGNIVNPARGNFIAGSPATRTCDAEELPNDSIRLLDAREPERFRGEKEPIDPVAGHIPGATCATFTDNISEGRFKSPMALRDQFEMLDIEQDDDIACYCGSGVTATHNILALLIAGYDEPALFPGSWSEGITDPARPISTGP